MITDETIEYIASVTRLTLTDVEKESAKKEINKLIEYLETMNELDTYDIKPVSGDNMESDIFRNDEVINITDKESLFYNTPFHNNGYFIVPKTIE